MTRYALPPLKAPVQREGPYRDGRERKPPGLVSWDEHAAAAAAYNKHHTQTALELAERGGFGYWELAGWLGHEPTTWEPR